MLHDRHLPRKVLYLCEHIGEVTIPIAEEAQTRALRKIEKTQHCPDCTHRKTFLAAREPAQRNREHGLPALSGTDRQIPPCEIIRDRSFKAVTAAMWATREGIWHFQRKKQYTRAKDGENALGALYALLKRYRAARACVEWFQYDDDHGPPRRMIEIAYERLPENIKKPRNKS